ncbi:TraB/VirB10 family protein, partial [Psychromonas aquimarina]|uniref:TraB/VirB10 family protein n=1 Tax=Psychromonas aquimarina TaxID=444919 RepID=UPI00048EA145
GDLASERAYLRGEDISCIREDGLVIETGLSAYAVGEDGKAGIKGTLVSRNSKVLINSMAAGFMEGLAGAFNVTPVPVISTNPTGQQDYQSVFDPAAVQGGAAKGAATSFEKLADYYMDLADAMHPVIEVGAGRVVDIVITKGTPL